MKRTIGLLCIVAALTLTWMPTAHAALFTLNFDNLDLDLGLSTVLPVTTEYSALWGVSFVNAYRYIDARDPWLDPGALPGPYNFGIANAVGGVSSVATINFDYGNTSLLGYHIWIAQPGDLHVAIYDASDVLLAQQDWTGTVGASGTGSFVGFDIAYAQFWSDGGSVQGISDITYESPGPIPEPGTLALLGTGLAGVAALRRRFKR